MEKITKKDIKKYLKIISFYSVIYSSALCSGLALGNYVTRSKYEKNNSIYQDDEVKITELSDLYLDLTDRGILLLSDNAKKCMNEISEYSLEEFDSSYTDILSIDVEELLFNYNEFEKICWTCPYNWGWSNYFSF